MDHNGYQWLISVCPYCRTITYTNPLSNSPHCNWQVALAPWQVNQLSRVPCGSGHGGNGDAEDVAWSAWSVVTRSRNSWGKGQSCHSCHGNIAISCHIIGCIKFGIYIFMEVSENGGTPKYPKMDGLERKEHPIKMGDLGVPLV